MDKEEEASMLHVSDNGLSCIIWEGGWTIGGEHIKYSNEEEGDESEYTYELKDDGVLWICQWEVKQVYEWLCVAEWVKSLPVLSLDQVIGNWGKRQKKREWMTWEVKIEFGKETEFHGR